VFWEFGIWGKSFTSRAVEFVWLGACDGVGSCRVGELGRDSCFGPLTFPNPSRPFPLTPPFSPPFAAPPSHLLLFQTLAATHQTLAAPISSSQGAFLCCSDLRRVVQIFDCFRWREEGRKKRGRTQGDFCVYLLFICAAIQLIRCGVCDWVEGLLGRRRRRHPSLDAFASHAAPTKTR
jgi:hypothetical protein